MVDLEQLRKYDGKANVQRIYRKQDQHQQLVNGSGNVLLPLALINGTVGWQGKEFGENLGQEKYGELLRVNNSA